MGMKCTVEARKKTAKENSLVEQGTSAMEANILKQASTRDLSSEWGQVSGCSPYG